MFCYSGGVEAERFVYPPYDAPLVEAYGGGFESVFVVLHPFVRVPEDLAWKATKQYPSDEQILRVGEKCSWATVAGRTGVRECWRLSQALLTASGSIADELCDYGAAEAVKNFVTSEAVWMPGAGAFEPLLQADFLDAFEAAGHEELVFVPEFPHADPVERVEVGGLKRREVGFPERGSLVAADESFLLTVDWDSYFTLFYGPRDFVSDVARRRRLEGFFAEPTTEHFWFNYSLGCCVVTMAPDGWAADAV